ncbi:hypothetical protein BJF89_17635 [Corynebacterium sp. CNJ-954]|uniref:YdcF family protein n=1 Tax=Corynebacterium sp. CNJ-954 TaxID=1904962 RepID=UPI00095F6D41|nr:YdcF family protein [Corynebacterium sp. CNJ-954]OLT53380.1 hypothetical protein BJF89_17635 [Corynebacterium sp. CNJ-954]
MPLTIQAIIATGIAAAQALSSTNPIGDIASEISASPKDSTLTTAHASAFAGAPIVILGARLNPDCAPAGVLNSRLDRAAAFVRLHPANRVIVTGGATQGGCFTEAQTMDSLLRARLVVNPIIQEGASSSTVENARNVDRIIPDTPSVLISSQDHLPRAMKNFADVGIRTFPVAAF